MSNAFLAGSLIVFLLTACALSENGQPTWEEIGNVAAGNQTPGNGSGIVNGTGNNGTTGNVSGNDTWIITPPPPVDVCPGVNPAGSIPFNPELGACTATCSMLSGSLKDLCDNSCHMKVTNSTGDPVYCKGLTMPQLAGRCYGMAAVAKKDRCVCARAPDTMSRVQCEAMFDATK